MSEMVAFSTQEFTHSPLVEVLLSVQFSPIEGLDCRHIGKLYEVFAERYPLYSEKPPLDPLYEVFSRSDFNIRPVPFQLIQQLPLPRIWMMDAHERQLLQFQNDRIILNWKKNQSGEAYPRYEAIRSEFISSVRQVNQYLSSCGLQQICPNQCEISYINHLHIKELPVANQVSGTFSGIFSHLLESGPCTPEDIRFMLRHVIKDENGEPIGRLITSVEPGVSDDNRLLVNFTLTARGQPAEPSIEKALEFLDRGREVINWSFLKSTSDEAHAAWGKVE